jgi:ABC-type nickel/cobalt efflux system permease component RcnA
VTVRVKAEGVVVHYQLEVDEWTVIFQDLPSFKNRLDTSRMSEPGEFYTAFIQIAGPLLAQQLSATLNDRPLSFTCTRQSYQIKDNVLCAFEFQAPWKLVADQSHAFTFRETNYVGQPGVVRLSLDGDPNIRLSDRSEPDSVLQARQTQVLTAEETARLRWLSATLQWSANPSPTTPAAIDTSPADNGETVEFKGSSQANLVRVFLQWKHGFPLLLLVFAGLGALHALTPGHGKTLVAAYLVGEHGTVWHALLLGLTTTLTHTGAVLVLAVVLMMFFPTGMTSMQQENLQRSLELIGGFLVAGLGLWLLLRRLAGQADHIHLGGSGHHHSHGHSHSHHHLAHTPTSPNSTWWGLIVLGISGGIVPCWDAVALLVWCVSANLLAQALPLLLSFSGGLAGVLILIGVLVVHTKALAGSRWDHSRLFKTLPLLSAVLVTALGLWLCYSSLRPNP